MGSRIYLDWFLGIGLCFCASAQSIEPGQEFSNTGCSGQIKNRDVMALDLEPLRRQPELAQKYVYEQAGDFRLVNTKPEEFHTRYRPSKDPNGVVRGARKFAAKRGCDLVLVLKTGNYFGRQRGWKRWPRIKDRGYALVVVGQRIAHR